MATELSIHNVTKVWAGEVDRLDVEGLPAPRFARRLYITDKAGQTYSLVIFGTDPEGLDIQMPPAGETDAS